MPEFRQNADDEIAEYLTISNEAGDEVRRIKPELAGLEEEVMPWRSHSRNWWCHCAPMASVLCVQSELWS